MQPLDGNAIGGLLAEVMGADMTAATGTCAHCGAIAAIAEGVAYLHVPGTVLRCRTCTGLLMAITEVRGRYCVDLTGLAAVDGP
jgi:phage FluMu protein Com